MTEELKPCPAGHQAMLYANLASLWGIECGNDACGWRMDADWMSRADAIKAWNIHPVEDELKRRVAELEEMIERKNDQERWDKERTQMEALERAE